MGWRTGKVLGQGTSLVSTPSGELGELGAEEEAARGVAELCPSSMRPPHPYPVLIQTEPSQRSVPSLVEQDAHFTRGVWRGTGEVCQQVHGKTTSLTD